MAIKAITPREIYLPYIGHSKYNFRSINFFIWLEENDFETGDQYLRAIIDEKLEFEGDRPDVSSLSDDQLNAIAKLLVADILEFDDSVIDDEKPSLELSPIEQLRTMHQAQVENARKRATETMKPLLRSMQRTMAVSKVFDPPKHMELFKQAERMRRMFELPSGFKAVIDSQRTMANHIGKIVNPLGEFYKPPLTDFARIGRTLEFNTPKIDIGSSLLVGDAISKTVLQNIKLAQTSMKLFDAHIGLQGQFSEDYLHHNFRHAGFLSTAEVGLNNLASKSASAEILARYHSEDIEKESVLALSLGAVQELDVFDDEQELSEPDIETLTTKVLSIVLFITGTEGGKISIQSVYALASLILTALAVYLTSQGASKKQLQIIIEQNERIIELKQEDIEKNERRYTHYRRLSEPYKLREAPDTESQQITVLNTDQIVIVSKVDGDWAFVEVIPFADEPRLTGWVHRGGLRTLALH